jgi:nucleotide sugar dehydrogenase
MTSAWTTRICVIGVGYVGRSLLRQFGSVFDCVGFDISEKSIQDARTSLAELDTVTLSTDDSILEGATHYLIAVPTPVRDDQSINLDYVISALQIVIRYARPGCCVVIESSIPVGTTRQLLHEYQEELHCGMSPERIDPGRAFPTPRQIPKLVAGLTRRAQKQIMTVYASAYDNVVPVSTPEVAEMTKLYENCFRMVNIAYANEMQEACIPYGIDFHEVVAAAATKPFGFLPFYPGLGVGGHCIPSNACYLLENGTPLPVLERATHLMLQRPHKIARRLHSRCLRNIGGSGGKTTTIPTGPRILIIGVAFKAGQSDIQGSPSLAFARTLHELGCRRLAYFDPLVKKPPLPFLDRVPEAQWSAAYLESEFDAVALCVRQVDIDFSTLDNLRNCIVQCYV